LFTIAVERNNLELFSELLKLLGDIYFDFGNFDKAVMNYSQYVNIHLQKSSLSFT